MKFYFKAKLIQILLLNLFVSLILTSHSQETEMLGENLNNSNDNGNESEEIDIWGKRFI